MLSENRESSNIYGVVGVKAGGKNDPKDATGIAHYLEHVLFKGTQELGTTDYENEKVYLDSISKLYENLSKTNSQEKRSSIQKEINRISIKASQYAIPNELDKLLKQMGGLDVNAFTNEDYTAYYNSFPPNQINRWLEIIVIVSKIRCSGYSNLSLKQFMRKRIYQWMTPLKMFLKKLLNMFTKTSLWSTNCSWKS